jgi:hypothetical protein
MKQLPLQKSNKITGWARTWLKGSWKTSAPFVKNTRGRLIHRPRVVNLYNPVDMPPHLSVHYYCGQQTTNNQNNLTFTDTLGEEELLCEMCETNARKIKLPTAESILRRHIHTGKIKLMQRCCALDKRTTELLQSHP